MKHETVDARIAREAWRQREEKGYTVEHDVEHVRDHPYVAVGLLAQYAAAGKWVKAAALARNFAEAAEVAEWAFPSLDEPEPETPPERVIVLAGSYRQFLEWCRENGRDPTRPHQTVYGTERSVLGHHNVDRLVCLPGFSEEVHDVAMESLGAEGTVEYR